MWIGGANQVGLLDQNRFSYSLCLQLGLNFAGRASNG